MRDFDELSGAGISPLPAFVLGVVHPRGIACVRSLARRGIPLVSVDHELPSSPPHFACRYVGRRSFIHPAAADAVDALEALAGARGGVLIPTSDEYLVFAAKNHARLSRTFRLSCPPWERLEPVMDRRASVELARKAGLPTVRTFDPQDERALDAILEELDFDAQRYVLKVSLSTASTADARLGRKTTYGGADRRELRARVLEIAARTGEFPAIQELVPGTTDLSLGVTMVVDRSGEPRVSYCVRRLKLETYSRVDDFRHPYHLGGNVFCETVHEPEALALARNFVRTLGWVGVITVEFRRDLRDGSLKFVKVDPRVVRSTSLSTAIGMDVPTALYDIAVGQPTSARIESYPSGVCWIWLEKYFESLWRTRRYASARRELIGLLRRLPDIDAFAYWDRSDPLPFVTQLALRLTFGRRWFPARRFAELIGSRRAYAAGGAQETRTSTPRV